MNLQSATNYAKDKTKLYIHSSTPEVKKLVLHIIDFLGNDIDHFDQESEHFNNNDFILYSSNTIEDLAIYQPNIVLIAEVFSSNLLLLENIVSGGILVYPDNAIFLETKLTKINTFFRKLPFSKTTVSSFEDTYTIDTALGEVPITSTNEKLINCIEGVRLFCQQLGIMEEEFYEALMNYK